MTRTRSSPPRQVALLAALLLIAASAVLVVRVAARNGGGSAGTTSEVRAKLASLPLTFVENRGQVHQGIDYYLQGADTTVGFSSEGLLLSLADPSGTTQRSFLGLRFVGADATEPVGVSKAPTVVSYFKGPLRDWIRRAPTYQRVAYRDLWPGIDLVYSGTGSRLKYSFLVQPGANPSDIRLAVRGATLEVNTQGQLEMATPAREIIDDTPYTYQSIGGRQVKIASEYAVSGDRYGFNLGSYDRSHPLIIDPVMLVYAGYIGGSGDESGEGIAVDSSGATYITGSTTSNESTFPDGSGFGAITGPDTTHNGGLDAFVAKLNPTGTSLDYASFIGGAGDDSGLGIAVDAAGAAYVSGSTRSNDTTFPDGEGFGTATGPDTTHNGGLDAFVAKLNPSGTSLTYAGFIGGSGFDSGEGLSVDASGAAYVTGHTSSDETTFPDGDGLGSLTGPDTSYNGGSDAFVAKVAPSGTSLDYAGYIGGSGGPSGEFGWEDSDVGLDVAVDSFGAAYVSGYATSDETTFPDGDGFGTVAGPDNTHNGRYDAFVAKIAPSGASLDYAGFIGGAADELGRGIAVDSAGAAYVTGQTGSDENSFPDGDGFGTVTGPDTTHNGELDAFVTKVAPSGDSLAYAGYIGGHAHETGEGIAVDSAGAAYVTGGTSTTSYSPSFPDGDGFGSVTGPDTTHNGGVWDAYVAKVPPAGTSLAYAGYIGGSEEGDFADPGRDIAVDSTGAAYVTGGTTSNASSFPDGDGFGNLTGHDTTHNGGMDAFVAKVSATETDPGPDTPTVPETRIVTPDVKLVRYIDSSVYDHSRCVKNLRSGLGLSSWTSLPSLKARTLCVAFDLTANPEPPRSFSQTSWNKFKAGKEYRSYVRIPPIHYTCRADVITSHTDPAALDFEHSEGFTPVFRVKWVQKLLGIRHPVLLSKRGAYVGSETYRDRSSALGFNARQPTMSLSSDGRELTVSYLQASRLSSPLRKWQHSGLAGTDWLRTRYDAAFIWTFLQQRLTCTDAGIRVVSSSMPSQFLYLGDKFYTETFQTQDLASFMKRGGRKFHKPGKGLLDTKCYRVLGYFFGRLQWPPSQAKCLHEIPGWN